MNERASRAAVAALGLLALAAFFLSCLQRLGSPLELGSGEGSLMDHAIRLAHGKPLYAAPSLEWVPFAYMPGMPLLAAPFVAHFGPQFWIGRLIDVTAAAALCLVFAITMWRETRSWGLGLAGAGIFLMGQGFTQGCYDVWRPDLPMLVVAFSAAATLRFTTGTLGAVFSAFLFALAFVLKQHGLVLGAVMVPYLFFADRRRLLPYLLALAVFAGGAFAILRAIFGPWFTFYVYEVPSHWSIVSRGRIQHYLGAEAFGRFAMLTVPGLLALSTSPWRERAGLWWWLALGGMGTGLMATLDPYAAFHTLMPGFCTFAFLGPIALHRLGAELPVARRGAYGWAVVLVVVAQMMALPFSPRALRPHHQAGAALNEFVDWVRGQRKVIVIYHGYYTWAAGQGTTVAMLPFDDVVRARGNSLIRRDPQYLERLFDGLRRGPNRPVLVSDTTLDMTGDAARAYWASLVPGYRLAGTLGDLSRRIAPVVGTHDMPKYVYLPVDPDSGAAPADSATAH